MVSIDQLYSEQLKGRLVAVGKAPPSLLVVGSGKLPAIAKATYRGDITLRFAFPLLFTKDLIFPTLVIDDHRCQHPGRAAIAFMLSKGNSYPRADAVGLLQSTQSRADLFMKEVDIADGLRVYAFTTDDPATPLARIDTAIWLNPKANGIEDLNQSPDAEDSLLPQAAHCYRCMPTMLAELLERISLAAGS